MLRQIRDAAKLAEENASTRDEKMANGVYAVLMTIIVGALLCALLTLISVACHAQRNEIALSAVGNFNPTSRIWIQNTPHDVTSSNRSSLGGGASYQRWLSEHVSLGLQLEANPSAGKLFWNTAYFRWPQMRYEIAAISSQQISDEHVSLFVREGAGEILTNGYSNSGWSHDLALLGGVGLDYHVSHRIYLRTGFTVLESRGGCYGDKTCRAPWAGTQDVSLGPVFRW